MALTPEQEQQILDLEAAISATTNGTVIAALQEEIAEIEASANTEPPKVPCPTCNPRTECPTCGNPVGLDGHTSLGTTAYLPTE